MKLSDRTELPQPIHSLATVNYEQSTARHCDWATDAHDSGRSTQAQISLHLNQKELARRWRMSPRTLERWRWLREGPSYLKIGGKVIYRLTEVEAFEATRVFAPGFSKERIG